MLSVKPVCSLRNILKLLSLGLILATGGTTSAQYIQWAENGLYKPATDIVRWGGPLSENTSIDLSSSWLNFKKGGTNYLKINNDGNIGIGAQAFTPTTQLSLGNNLGNSKLALWDGGDNGPLSRYGFGIQSWQFRLFLGGAGGRFSFFDDEAGTTELMTIKGDGNVGIGTNNPQGKLAVNGTIFAKKITVTATGWADYVFDPGYSLRPLTELEQYILSQKHLPEVPTTAEVEKNGIDLGENQTLLLKKVEELTLYVIELNKQVKKQQEEIQSLKQQLK